MVLKIMKEITIKVDKKIIEIVNEMIKLKIAKNKEQAYNMIIKAGIEKIIELIKRKEKEKIMNLLLTELTMDLLSTLREEWLKR